MPKSLSEIRTFQYGIISTPSETDIPQEAATFSVDVDPILEGGKLGGMPGHTEETDSASASIPADQMCFIEAKNGTRTLAYVDHSATSLKYITDFEGTRGAISTSSTVFNADDDYAALAVHGHEVHIGMGPTTDTKWYGYVTNDQFGSNTCGTLPEYLDAKLEKFNDVTDGFGGLHKVITAYEGSFAQIVHIGIGWKSTELRAFDSYDLTTEFDITLISLSFTSLQAICEDPTDPNYFYVYDKDDTEYGTVYRVGITSLVGTVLTLTKDKAIVINGWGTAGLEEPDEYEVSDMISDNHIYNSSGTYTNCYMYFAMHKENGGVPIVKLRSEDVDEVFSLNEEYRVGYATLIFRSEDPHPEYADGTTMDTHNVTPNLKGEDEDTAEAGHFFLDNDVTDSSTRFDIYTVKRPFFNVGIRDSGSSTPVNGSELIGYWFTSKEVTVGPKVSTSDESWKHIGLAAMILKPFTYGVDYTDRSTYDFNSSHLRILNIGSNSYNYSEPPYYGKIVNSFQSQLFRAWYSSATLPYLVVLVSTDSSTKAMIFDPDCAYQAMTGSAFPVSGLEYYVYAFDEMGATVSRTGSPETSTSIDLTGMTMFAPSWSGSVGTGDDTNIKFVSEYGGIISGEISVLITSTTAIDFDGVTYTDTPDLYCMAYQSSGQDADGIRAGEILTYHIALEYDGYQIAPISEPIATITPSEDGKPIIVNVYLQESVITDISPRVSGAYILRGTKNSLVGTSFASIPRVVERLDFSIAKNEVTLAGTSGYYKYQVYDRNRLGETFEQLSGYSADAEVCTPNYGISCVGNDQLLVGDCQGFDGECDSTNILYLSEPGKYDQFNLSTNFVILSDKPTAMCFWRGKFYVFSSSKMWRINPNGPYIEDDFEGIGVEGPQGVIANEFGIFVAGVKGIYLDVGSGFVPIGDTILNSENGNYGWNDRDTSYSPIVFFEPERKAFCASFKWDGIEDLTLVYAYSIGLKRWDLWQMVAEKSLNGVLTGRDGVVYAAAETNVYSIFANKSSRRSYIWHSKVLDMGANSKDKKFYEVRIPYQGTWSGTITAEDHDGTSISLTDASITGMKVLTCNTRDRGLKIKLANVAGSCLIDSIGVVYRHLSGVH